MAVTVKTSVTGSAEMAKALRKIRFDMREKIIRKAVVKAAAIIRKAARENVRVQADASPSATLKKAIGTKTVMYKGSTIAVSITGIDKSVMEMVSVKGRKAVKQRPVNIAHLIQSGHRIGIRGRKLARVKRGEDRTKGGAGFVQAFPFMFEYSESAVLSAMESVIAAGIASA